ncbi:MAG: hypothetical protein IPL55_00225 [Saprospiraceae bacterium]|nr:hypothetical protein [Saprospiraceae bacterium]
MNAILNGISRANEYLSEQKNLKRIEAVEFIELYEHIAQNAYYQLAKLQQDDTIHLSFDLVKNWKGETGAQRKIPVWQIPWWHEFTTRLIVKDQDKKILICNLHLHPVSHV